MPLVMAVMTTSTFGLGRRCSGVDWNLTNKCAPLIGQNVVT